MFTNSTRSIRPFAFVLAVASAWSGMNLASASDKLCIGAFQDTSYASLMGLSRYAIFCDDGKDDTVQQTWAYSKSSREKLFAAKVVPMARKMGVVRVLERTSNYQGDFDVFLSSGAPAPTRIALLRRMTSKRGGVVTESLQLTEAGKRTLFPESRVSSPTDLSNVDKIAAQEGMNRGGMIRTYSVDKFEIYVLYR